MKVFKLGAVLLTAAVVTVAPLAATAARAGSGVLSNVGFSQTASVNAAQTKFPVRVHWTNNGAAATVKVYRDDYNTGTSVLLGHVAGSVGHFDDVLPMSHNPVASSDFYHYQLESYDANGKLLGTDVTSDFAPEAFDNSASVIHLRHGTWNVQKAAGATLGEYAYSSSAAAAAAMNLCYFNIGLVATTSPSGGTANILVNGTLVKQVSFKSSTTRQRVLLWKTGFPTDSCNLVKIVRTTGRINVDTIQIYAD